MLLGRELEPPGREPEPEGSEPEGSEPEGSPGLRYALDALLFAGPLGLW